MKRLVLVGGGHAHLHVLQGLAGPKPEGVEVVLVTPQPRVLYSGMVPGVIAGHYAESDAAIDVGALARRCGVPVITSRAIGLDPVGQRLALADGGSLSFDVASLDIGGETAADTIDGAERYALFARPLEALVADWHARLGGVSPPRDVAVIGGGAGGAELAMAAAWRLGPSGRVRLVTGGDLMAGYPVAVVAKARAALQRLGVELLPQRCARIEARGVELENGPGFGVDLAIVATGSVAPRWLRDTGLALDAQGFVATGPTLASTSHAAVFAAGDVSSRTDAPHPRSGVYAVRAGAPLLRNLLAALRGTAGMRWQPQAVSLNLVSCGRRSAIASRGRWCAQGRWAWWWKDRIDRAFVARFRG
jgi:pyridine nucleotide-disulfide oxidoreductase family protein